MKANSIPRALGFNQYLFLFYYNFFYNYGVFISLNNLNQLKMRPQPYGPTIEL